MAVTLLLVACSSAGPTTAATTQPSSGSSGTSVATATLAPLDDSAPDPCTGRRSDDASAIRGRTDVTLSGNRVATGAIDLVRTRRVDIRLPARPVWIVSHPGPDGPCAPSWYVTLDDGNAVIVDSTGTVSDAGVAIEPPETDASGEILDAHRDQAAFTNALLDTRVVRHGPWAAALVEPTERYGHGVLGDRIEAGGVEILDTRTNTSSTITIEPPAVIEGISPILIDVDDDGDPEVLVTVSDEAAGARLVLYSLDGSIRAQSQPIGRTNRWRNQLGGAHVGANGRFEVVDVRTPHLDGVVEFFAVDDDRLELVASITGYTTHSIGSRNLDLGLIVDADADERLEIIVPTRDLSALAVLERTEGGVVETARVELDGTMAANLATQPIDGRAWLATGTSDGRLVVFGGGQP